MSRFAYRALYITAIRYMRIRIILISLCVNLALYKPLNCNFTSDVNVIEHQAPMQSQPRRRSKRKNISNHYSHI